MKKKCLKKLYQKHKNKIEVNNTNRNYKKHKKNKKLFIKFNCIITKKNIFSNFYLKIKNSNNIF